MKTSGNNKKLSQQIERNSIKMCAWISYESISVHFYLLPFKVRKKLQQVENVLLQLSHKSSSEKRLFDSILFYLFIHDALYSIIYEYLYISSFSKLKFGGEPSGMWEFSMNKYIWTIWTTWTILNMQFF